VTPVSLLARLRATLEYLGGALEAPPAGSFRLVAHPATIGLVWAILLLLVVAFSGQSSKFIYIDF
jgi:hypothetical protein